MDPFPAPCAVLSARSSRRRKRARLAASVCGAAMRVFRLLLLEQVEPQRAATLLVQDLVVSQPQIASCGTGRPSRCEASRYSVTSCTEIDTRHVTLSGTLFGPPGHGTRKTRLIKKTNLYERKRSTNNNSSFVFELLLEMAKVAVCAIFLFFKEKSDSWTVLVLLGQNVVLT